MDGHKRDTCEKHDVPEFMLRFLAYDSQFSAGPKPDRTRLIDHAHQLREADENEYQKKLAFARDTTWTRAELEASN